MIDWGRGGIMTDDIKERLRTEVDGNTALYEEAAARIEELEATVARLEGTVASANLEAQDAWRLVADYRAIIIETKESTE